MMKWLVGWVAIVVGSPALAQPIPRLDGGHIARLTSGTHASLSPDGLWFGSTCDPFSFGGDVLAVSDDTGARLQFVEHAPGVEIVLYAERSTLQDVALDGAALYPNAASAHRPLGDLDPGMKLESGRPIRGASPTENGLLKVT